jgi:hypothetical protein
MTEAQFDPQAALAWLDTLFPAETPGLIHISATGNWAGRAFTDRGQAVEYMASHGRPRRRLPALHHSQSAARTRQAAASEDDSLALPGLWADLDIAGPGHKTTEQLPPTSTRPSASSPSPDYRNPPSGCIPAAASTRGGCSTNPPSSTTTIA